MPEPFPWSNWTLSYDLKLEEIAYAERLGYDEVWVGEHHTGAYENIPAPDIFIAKASALTNRMRLGTGTILRPYQAQPQFSIAGMSGTHNFALCGERGYAALSIYFTPARIEDNPGMPDL